MTTRVEWMERHQVPLYLGALVAGAVLGLAMPAVSGPASLAINPALGLLLYATFLGVPFARIADAVRDWRFLSTVLVVNFVLVPLVAFGLSRWVAHDPVLLVGVLFVLLAPCVDYVIVFTGLAGGAQERLLAATPLLMGLQMVALPVYLWLFVGAEFVAAVDFAPFIAAFVGLVLLPLAAAALMQWAAPRSGGARRMHAVASHAMVPLMMLTLAVVVASQIGGVATQLPALLGVVPVYVLFAVVMVALGALAGRLAGLDARSRVAIIFSGVTRNSLVILPLVLALPEAYDLAALVVVTQTLVELLVMVALVHLLSRTRWVVR